MDEARGRLIGLVDRLRVSLFFVPMLFVLAAILLGLLSVEVDDRVDTTGDLSFVSVAGTVESARAVLSTVAGATITVAGIAFSISLLVIQLASSQYSPRVVHGIFRDPFNKRAIGVVVGTFTFCLVVLRSVRAPSAGEAVVPNLSVGLAVVFGIASVLTIIAFINYNAHSVDVGEILGRATEQGLEAVRSTWPHHVGESGRGDRGEPTVNVGVPAASGLSVPFVDSGWIQQLDHELLGGASDPGGVVRFESTVGRYAVSGAPMCVIWPAPEDPDRAARVARSALQLGNTRSLLQDPTYAIRQLADVAIKALSPGVNDPTTAQEAIFRLGTMVHEFLSREPPARVRRCREHRVVLLPEAPDHADVVDLAFAEVRRAAAPHPAVCSYLLETLRLVELSLEPPARSDAIPLLHDQARRLVASAARALDDPDDVAEVRRAFAQRFPADPGTAVPA